MESIFVKFAQYPSIETERLLLRPVTLDDAEAMFDPKSFIPLSTRCNLQNP
ncbi:acetyltransferase [Streptococcus pneumoniae]|nr:acetyltransferase [Streptococcus pneumoniae]VOO99377.1 acetyltransferase [Streptococcus pneumoniae]VQN45608.1 acetyltransferase [Streptococcus pneumoniae]